MTTSAIIYITTELEFTFFIVPEDFGFAHDKFENCDDFSEAHGDKMEHLQSFEPVTKEEFEYAIEDGAKLVVTGCLL